MPIRSVVATPPHIVRYADGSEWHFRAVRDEGDEDAIQALTTSTVTKQIKPKELRRARREHRLDELVMESITHETTMSAKRATLYHMTISWSGPEFVIDANYVKGEEFKQPEKDASGRFIPHPLAGQLAPVAPEWVGVRDPDELDAILEALEEVWAGRSEADQTEFPGRSLGVVGSGSAGESEDNAFVSDTDH